MWHVMIISICPQFSLTSLYCLLVSHSPSPHTVNPHLKWQHARTLHKPAISLPLPYLPPLLHFLSSPSLSLIHSILIPLFLYILSSSHRSLTGISRQPERKSEGIRLGLKCNIRLLKRLVVDIWLSELPPNLMNWHSWYWFIPRLLLSVHIHMDSNRSDMVAFMRHLVTRASW